MYRLPRGAIITVVSCDLDNTLWCIASLLRSASDAMYSAMERSEFGRAVAARFPRTEFTKVMEVVRCSQPEIAADWKAVRRASLLHCAMSLDSACAEDARAWAGEIAAEWFAARNNVDTCVVSGADETLRKIKKSGRVVRFHILIAGSLFEWHHRSIKIQSWEVI
eukprot:704890_1